MQGHAATLSIVPRVPFVAVQGPVILLVQAGLGLSFVAIEPRIAFSRPPDVLGELTIEGFSVGGAVVDLLLTRHRDEAGWHVLRRKEIVDILIEK